MNASIALWYQSRNVEWIIATAKASDDLATIISLSLRFTALCEGSELESVAAGRIAW
jgi:hypothetical protein